MNEPLYRIDLGRIHLEMPYTHGEAAVKRAIDEGWLVPVRPCEHGNLDGHMVRKGGYRWCLGSPLLSEASDG